MDLVVGICFEGGDDSVRRFKLYLDFSVDLKLERIFAKSTSESLSCVGLKTLDFRKP